METHALYAHAELQFLLKFDCVGTEYQYRTYRLFVPNVIFFPQFDKEWTGWEYFLRH